VVFDGDLHAAVNSAAARGFADTDRILVLKGKDSTRIELIAADFSGSIRGDQYTSVKSVYQFASEIAGADLHFARLQTFNMLNSTTTSIDEDCKP
jgi:hypothetical protein